MLKRPIHQAGVMCTSVTRGGGEKRVMYVDAQSFICQRVYEYSLMHQAVVLDLFEVGGESPDHDVLLPLGTWGSMSWVLIN